MSLYRRKGSPHWWVKISIAGVIVQRSSGTANKAQAMEYHDTLKANLWQQKRLGVKPKRFWHEAVTRWLVETADKRTHKEDINKLKWLDDYLGNLALDEISLAVIDNIKAAKLKEAKKTTVNRYLALVRAILKKAQLEWEWVDKVVKVRLYQEPRGRERALTKHEFQALMQELPAHMQDIISLAVFTGLRQNNIARLQWSWIDLATGYITVPADNSKNGSPIPVFMEETAKAIILRQQGKHPRYVFTYRGNPIATLNTRAWRNALKRAGIENFRWHDLRHTWATWHRQAGTPTHELQKLGGWKTAVMVERYAHIAPEALKGAAARLENYLRVYVGE